MGCSNPAQYIPIWRAAIIELSHLPFCLRNRPNSRVSSAVNSIFFASDSSLIAEYLIFRLNAKNTIYGHSHKKVTIAAVAIATFSFSLSGDIIRCLITDTNLDLERRFLFITDFRARLTVISYKVTVVF